MLGDLLADAKRELDEDYKEISTPERKQAATERRAESKASMLGAGLAVDDPAAEAIRSFRKAESKAERLLEASAEKSGGEGAAEAAASGDSDDDGDSIIHKVSEYLFDLFDANCMEEYHLLQRFEAKAWPKFDPDEDEYTFEQQDLHKEFCALFESLTEKFILSEGYSIERFYKVVAREAEKRKGQGTARDAVGGEVAPRPWGETDDAEDAEEVVEVVFQVADFQLWAAEMRGIARNNMAWQARRAQDEVIYRDVRGGGDGGGGGGDAGGGGGGGGSGAGAESRPVQFSPNSEVSTLAARLSLKDSTSPHRHTRVLQDGR